jgi:Na+-translocating ferredoxin:NAD+ oxidoreductase subunit E
MPDTSKPKSIPLSQVFLKGAFIHNPVLVQVIGICPVVAAAKSLYAAAFLAGVYSVILILTQFIASVFLKKIIRWIRVAVYLLIGLAVVGPAVYLLDKYALDIRITAGIYLPLLAANSLAALRCEKIAVRSSVKHSFFDSIAASIGYSVVLLLTGALREVIGIGTIAGKDIPFLPEASKMPSGMLLPFGGFIVLGFMAAALKWFVLKYYPKYAKAMKFDISATAVTLKEALKEPGVPLNDEPVHQNISVPKAAAHASEPEVLSDSSEDSVDSTQTPLSGFNNGEETIPDYTGPNGYTGLPGLPEDPSAGEAVANDPRFEEEFPEKPVLAEHLEEDAPENSDTPEAPECEEPGRDDPVSEKNKSSEATPEKPAAEALPVEENGAKVQTSGFLSAEGSDSSEFEDALDIQALDRRINDLLQSLEENDNGIIEES